MSAPVLEFQSVSKSFGSAWRGVQVLNDINLTIAAGETLGVVGESGSGKSTIARLALGVEQPTNGTVKVNGSRPLKPGASGAAQIVFQDPASSLNPLIEISRSVEEPLTVSRHSKDWRDQRVDTVLDEVGVNSELRSRMPPELSGGQKQRASIARALAALPPLMVCDEAVTALDVSIRAQVLNLLRRVQDEHDTSMLFISHDLSTVAYMSDRIVVLYLGKIMEIATTSSVLANPGHPYTYTLLSAVPTMQQGGLKRERVILSGEAPSLVTPPPGCRFSSRCPIAKEVCRTVEPPLAETHQGNWVACHFPHTLGQREPAVMSA